MNLIDNIKNKTLIITTVENKNKILLNLNKLYDIKFMTKEDFLKKYLFDYNEETIYYIMKKYNVNYDICKIYLNNLYFVNSFISKKTEFLYNLKQELIDNNLLIFDDLFKKYVNSVDIIIYDYQLNKFEKNIFDKLDSKIINNENNIKISDVYEFDFIEQEIEFVCTSIIDLINKNIDINKIKILNVTDEYLNYIKRIFKLYNIPIDLPNKTTLYGNADTIKFLQNLKETKDIKSSLELINNEKIYNKIVAILNKYNFKNIDDIIIECLINEFKNTKLDSIKLKQAVQIINFDYSVTDEYVFLIGFNDSSIPRLFKDEDYLTDEEKNNLKIDTSLDSNELEKNKIINKISNVENLIITYKLKTPYETYFKSNLVDELNLNIIKNIEIKNKYNYSNSYNKFALAKNLDRLNKYNEHSLDLDKLLNTYKDINYNKYDNKYKTINKNNLYDYVNNKLTLSYSSIENYYECGFKYYLSNVLKLDKYEETIFTEIGTIFHEVLSKCFSENFNLDIYYNNLINKKEHTKKELVFFNKLKIELEFIINTIKKYNTYSHLNNELYEQKIVINKDANIKINFMGIVDKIKYGEYNNKTLVAVIDYKTGFPETDLTKTIYGLKMQLPIYLYLVKNSNLFDSVEIVGLYLQKILNGEINYNEKKDYIKEKENNLKLEGYSIDNEELLNQFDVTYKDSEMIKSMKVGNNGFYAYTKTLSSDKLNKLLKLTSDKIDEARDDILEAKFDINPKRINSFNSCEYCKYKYICYKKEEDIIDLKEYKDLSFLD